MVFDVVIDDEVQPLFRKEVVPEMQRVVLCKLEHVQRDGPGGAARTMDQQTDVLGGLARECRLSATRTNPRWNMLHQHAAAIYLQHLAYKLIPGGFAAADVALERCPLPWTSVFEARPTRSGPARTV